MTPGDRTDEVPSPCIRHCCLDDNDVCLGCGRLLAEILAWRDATATEREAILALAAKRRAARERRWSGRSPYDP
jgi:uncharacterized protein